MEEVGLVVQSTLQDYGVFPGPIQTLDLGLVPNLNWILGFGVRTSA